MTIASSGNVFADLGFENSAEEQIKADLVLGIVEVIARRRLSQTAAAKLMDRETERVFNSSWIESRLLTLSPQTISCGNNEPAVDPYWRRK